MLADPKNESIVAGPGMPAGAPGSGEPRRSVAGWLDLPRLVWIRIGIFLAALGIAKCGVIVALRGELFQAHWRILEEEPTLSHWVTFYCFVIVAGANLWLFGKRCAAQPDRATQRRATIGILGLVAAFVLLTFHEGRWNYLHALMTGVLTWKQVGSFISLRLFFGPPYLAGWMLGMGALGYLLIRTGRERWLLRCVAVVATLYLATCLRQFANHQAELLTLTILGLVSLLVASRAQVALRWPLAFAPCVLAFGGFLLFRGFEPRIDHPTPQFLTLMGGGLILFVGASLLAWRRGIYVEWSWLLPFASLSFLLLVTANFPDANNYRHLLVFGLALPRYFAGIALVGLLLFCLARLYRQLRPGGGWWWWLDVLGLVLVALAILDLRLTQIIGVRLDWQVIAFADSPKMMWRMARPYLPLVMGSLVLFVAAYAGLMRWLQRRPVTKPQPWGQHWLLREYLVTLFILLALVGGRIVAPDKAQGEVLLSLLRSSPWWKNLAEPPLTKAEFVEKATALGLGSMLQAQPSNPASSPRDLNVVLIFQESTYNQHLSLFGGTNETQPLLKQYQGRMELFPNFFSNFASSIHARFATFAGLYPVRDFQRFTKEHVPVKSIFDVLSAQGYETSLFYSSFLDYTNFRDLMARRGLAKMYDADTMPGQRKTAPVSWGLKEEETMCAIVQQIKAYATNQQKFFLTYVPAAPHYPFDGIPAQFMKFPVGNLDDYTSRYQNELLYMDWVITGILDELKRSGLLTNTLVIITSDHGEMLGADGGIIGHGWKMTPELANVPLIIMDPQRAGLRINPVVGGQVDLLPTVLDVLGIPIPADQLYQGTSLYGPATNSPRTMYLNSFGQFAIIKDSTVHCGDREDKHRTGGAAFRISNQGALT